MVYYPKKVKNYINISPPVTDWSEITLIIIAFLKSIVLFNKVQESAIAVFLFVSFLVILKKVEDYFFPQTQINTLANLIFQISNQIKTSKNNNNKEIIRNLKFFDEISSLDDSFNTPKIFKNRFNRVKLFFSDFRALPKKLNYALSNSIKINTSLLEKLSYSLYIDDEEELFDSSHKLFKEVPQEKNFHLINYPKFLQILKPWAGLIIYSLIILIMGYILHNYWLNLEITFAIITIFLSPVAVKIVNEIKKD